MRRIRIAVVGVAAVCVVAILPAVASADCTLTELNNGGDITLLSGGTTQTFSGHFGKELNGKFIQIPFTVGSGIKGMKIRYCFEKSNAADDNPTLDLGVYGAKSEGATSWTQAERRGWSGSAVRAIGIGENGYTEEATYNANTDAGQGVTRGNRKAYAPGFTTRAYKPGPIAAGDWAVELGAGWIDPDGAGVDWKVEVATSTNTGWEANEDAIAPDPYIPNVANPAAGWYTGDLHVHGEMEPGNAPMSQTFGLGFGANGLDFMTIVDHNNDNARSILGSYQDANPGKLISPGIEVTTYNGHANAQGSSNFADFRFSEVYRWDDPEPADNVQTDEELSLVRGPIDPSSQFQTILDGGGFTQVNHPETLKTAPSLCRGCAWTYTDEQTDWSKVSALEIQNGAAGIVFGGNPPVMNAFTVASIATYERLLADGFHIAAVGSSDDHQGGEANTGFDSQVGRGATVVNAEQLSAAAITTAVRAGHTYVKPFGADAPDVELLATTPAGTTAIPGDTVSGSGLDISIDVKGAASAPRPGPYTLNLLQDGILIDSIQVSGDDFNHEFNVTESGRYSFSLTRPLGVADTAIEAYSTPVWFTFAAAPKPSNAFSFGAYKANRKKATATLKVKVTSPGKLKLTGPGLNTATAKVTKKNQTVTLNLRPKASLKKKLKKRGSAKVKVKVTNSPTGGKALTKSKTVKLLARKAKKRR
jgi:hypothetical protein